VVRAQGRGAVAGDVHEHEGIGGDSGDVEGGVQQGVSRAAVTQVAVEGAGRIPAVGGVVAGARVLGGHGAGVGGAHSHGRAQERGHRQLVGLGGNFGRKNGGNEDGTFVVDVSGENGTRVDPALLNSLVNSEIGNLGGTAGNTGKGLARGNGEGDGTLGAHADQHEAGIRVGAAKPADEGLADHDLLVNEVGLGKGGAGLENGVLKIRPG